MHAVRLRRAVADDIESQLAPRSLRPAEHLAFRRTQHLRELRHDIAFRQTVERLPDNFRALVNLQIVHPVTIPVVPVFPDGNVKLEFRIDAVPVHLADVNRYAHRADIWPRHVVAERLLFRHGGSPVQPVLQNLVPRQDILILLHEFRHDLQEFFAEKEIFYQEIIVDLVHLIQVKDELKKD